MKCSFPYQRRNFLSAMLEFANAVSEMQVCTLLCFLFFRKNLPLPSPLSTMIKYSSSYNVSHVNMLLGSSCGISVVETPSSVPLLLRVCSHHPSTGPVVAMQTGIQIGDGVFSW